MNPQSKEVLDRLLAGQRVGSGRNSVGSLVAPALQLLRILIANQDDLLKRTGADQAKRLRELFAAETDRQRATQEAALRAERAPGDGPERAESLATRGPATQRSSSASVTPDSPAGWRLSRVCCQNIRGVAPPGETLEFCFDTASNLIFGPNGSGKSSLLGAVVWALTGQVSSDAFDGQDRAPVYRLPNGDGKGSKACEWPILVTLPETGMPSPDLANCWAAVELKGPEGRAVTIRRSYPGTMEMSGDGVHWEPCADLSQAGISPLDLQLSLLAPTIFGRRTIESAPDTRHLLSLMLGYDDLEALGELASKIARNRTALANTEREQLEAARGSLRSSLDRLPALLSEKSPARQGVDALVAVHMPTLADLEKCGKDTVGVLKEAQESLARVLGMPTGEKGPPADLADRLTRAIALLERGTWDSFPRLGAIRLESVFPGTDSEANARLAATELEFSRFIERAEGRIAKRLEWWRKETAPGSKLGLKVQAAADYDPTRRTCPVCGQSIEHLAIKDELASLKKVDEELRQNVTAFFRRLGDELDAVVRPEIRRLAAESPQERIKADWVQIRDQVLGADFASITAHFEEKMAKLADELVFVRVPASIAISDADREFWTLGEAHRIQLQEARDSLALLTWARDHLQPVRTALDDPLTGSPDLHPGSLLAELSKGKQAAADVAPLAQLCKDLRTVYKDRKALGDMEAQLAVLDQLESCLDAVKPLSKYAVEQVSAVFTKIREKTLLNWRKLYPESPSGLEPARLCLGKGRDKSVEALLSCGDSCEVPGQYFANAGLQRGVALSFFASLLEEHPGGLAFVVLDDPILSLDEDHRETWCANILKPFMDEIQVVLATHQKQFQLNCGEHFRSGQVIELNPRPARSRLSWRPGNRLQKAEEELQRDYTAVPNILRKYREELLVSLSARGPRPFYDQANLARSLNAYAAFSPPHPLAGANQQTIVQKLRCGDVIAVLDPGSHAATEANVSRPMVVRCLTVLREVDKVFRKELDRLDAEKAHARRGTAIVVPLADFPVAAEQARWRAALPITFIGRAAAKAESVVVDFAVAASRLDVPPGGAVLVSGSTLEPVARPGQWVLLADETVSPADGDLVALSLGNGMRLLRRIWSDGELWSLECINPVRPIRSVRVRKRDSAVRKVIGAVYQPERPVHVVAEHQEWQPRGDFDTALFQELRAISVEGDSLDPIAKNAQWVLVGEKTQAPEAAALAAVESTDERVGNVIKRVYPGTPNWLLVSPNMVDPHPPICMAQRDVVGVWPIRGVLFEALPAEGHQG